MFRKELKSKRRVIAPLMLCVIMAFSGCEKKIDQIEDYGGEVIETTESKNSKDDKSENGKTTDEGSDIYSNSSMGSLEEKLGGKQLEYRGTTDAQGQNVNINLVYEVPEVQAIPTYKITPITRESLREEDIVKNIFGDTAVPITPDNRKYISEALGDSVPLLEGAINIQYHNGKEYNWVNRSCPAWTDDEGYSLHTYEGQYHGMDYELVISYSDKFRELGVVLFPKKLSDIVGKEDVNQFSYTGPDGILYFYYHDNIQSYDIATVFADRPNECTTPEDQLLESIYDTMQNQLYVGLPESGVSLHDNIYYEHYNVDEDSLSEDGMCEAVFFDEAVLEDETLPGAVRHGYVAPVMLNIGMIPFIPSVDTFVQDADDLKVGAVMVDDNGVAALEFTASYSFGDQLSDNVTLLSFENAMACLEKAIASNIDTSKVNTAKGNLEFNHIELMYYPLTSPNNSEEGTYVPAWVVDSGSGNMMNARIIINAVDGTYIDTIYE
ncbi:MAG: hypothetical protein IJ065_01895 [Eubacterium sp.]|nr:hypothetical protein [Eubacterium sp.]